MEAREQLIEPRPVISPKILEPQTAKEILAGFSAPGQARLRRLYRGGGRRRFLDWSLRNAGNRLYPRSCFKGLRLQTQAPGSIRRISWDS